MIKQENLQKTNLRHGLLTGGKESSREAFILNIYLECYGRNKGECSVFDKKNLVLHNHYGLRLSSTQSKIILPYSQNLQMQFTILMSHSKRQRDICSAHVLS